MCVLGEPAEAILHHICSEQTIGLRTSLDQVDTLPSCQDCQHQQHSSRVPGSPVSMSLHGASSTQEEATGTILKDVRNELSTLDAQCSAVSGKLQHRADCQRQRISTFEGEVIKAFGSRDADMNRQVVSRWCYLIPCAPPPSRT